MSPIKLVLCTILLMTGPGLHATESTEDREQTLQSLLAKAGSAQARGDFAAAAESYRKAVEIDPEIPELWANLGLMDHEAGKHTEAMQSFKQAIKMKPSLYVPQLFLGIEYLTLQDPNAALPFLKSAANLNPKDPQAAKYLGRAYSMLDKGDQAGAAFLAAIRLAPNDGNSWLALGTSYLQQVEKDARLLNSVYKESPYAKLRAAETLAEEGKLLGADAAFKSALAFPTLPPCAHVEYGITLLRLEKHESAQQQFQLEKQSKSPCEINQKGTSESEVNHGLPLQLNVTSAECSSRRKDGVENSIVYEKRSAICSFYSGAYEVTSSVAQSLKSNSATMAEGLYWESRADQKLAVAALTRAAELAPNSPQMLVLIGDVYRQKRQWSEAEAEYRKAIALEPASRTARLNLAIVLFTELKSDEAWDMDNSILAEYPSDAEANLLASEILVQRHEYERAEPYIGKCNGVDGDLLPRVHVLRGQIYAETGRIPEAIAEYKLGLSSDQDGSVHYQLARVYQKSGDSVAASEQMRISKQLREHWDHQAHVALEQRSTDLSKQ